MPFRGDGVRSRSWLWTLLTLLLIAAGSYGLYAYLRPEPLAEQLLYANGHIEGTEINVAAETTGVVVENRLVEGETVARGDLLVRLDDTDLRLRKAEVAAEIGALIQERERAERELELSRHHLATAGKELARNRELEERGTVPPRRLEEAQDAFEEARARVAAGEAAVAATDARINAARQQLELIENRISKTRITAPIDGTVVTKAVERGELMQPGMTAAVLVDLSEVELRVFVPERNIGKLRLGAPARIRVDAFSERTFEARVARVDQKAQFTPRDIHMPEERVRMVFGVTLSVENPGGVLKPGMPADAWILWQPGADWPERLFVPV